MKRSAHIAEIVAAVAIVVFVAALFVNPAKPVSSAPGATYDGAQIFAGNCASCHGTTGGGGIGPQLAQGHAVSDFPQVADEIALVTHGRGGMPAWGGRLNAGEIAAVVAYTRTL